MTFEINQLVEIGWTSNHRRYRAVAKVIVVNAKSVQIKLYNPLTIPKAYKVFDSWTVSTTKQTRDNFIKSLETDQQIIDIMNFNTEESRLNEIAEKAINQFWKNRISKAEEQQKKDGVYVESVTWNINLKTGELENPKRNMRISE